MRDLYDDENANNIVSIANSQEDQESTQPQWTFIQEILGDDYVANEQITNDGNDIVPIRVKVLNLDDFSKIIHHVVLMQHNKVQ